jgi:hypothetical protein
MTLAEAIDTLASTYADPVLIARGLPVDAKEVADALAEAQPDTVEFVVLTLLAQLNPYEPPKTKPRTTTE